MKTLAKKKYILSLVAIMLVLMFLGRVNKNRDIASYSDDQTINTSVQLLTENGGRVDWSHTNNLITFDRYRENGFYDIYTMEPDGSNQTCITCDRDALGLPHKHIGQPAWHPNGRLIVFQAEKDDHFNFPSDYIYTPGAGTYNDLWIIDTTTKKTKKIHNVQSTGAGGTLHPHFSNDGSRISWTNLKKAAKGKGIQQYGFWQLVVADFNEHDLSLTNISFFAPGGNGFYESHGFSPDDAQIIYTSNSDGSLNNIHTINSQTGKLLDTLTSKDYNEHASFSPTDNKIVWMSGPKITQTDFWIMKNDGTDKKQLTQFTTPRSNHYLGKNVVASDSSWAPDGQSFVGYVQTGNIFNRKTYTERIYLITMTQ